MVTESVIANSRKPADDIAHEQQRDENRHQRNGKRDDRKTDLFGAFERGAQRMLALFDEADDIFNHHDGVVHYETRRNGQGHQGQIVQAIAQQIHHAERPHQRQRDGYARDNGG